MDQITHDLRLANWKAIIDSCQTRPENQTAREWLAENNVSEKQYYYWLRRIRKLTCEEQKALPAAGEPMAKTPALTFAEFTSGELFSADSAAAPMITIRTKKSTIEISSGISEKLVVRLVKAVAHAL